MNSINACHYFVPVVREGLATLIKDAAAGSRRAQLEVVLTAKAAIKGSVDFDDSDPPITQKIALYGPGDILGFDERIVTRTDPKPDAGDFESNYFPLIEFADFDFPWRFTANCVPNEAADGKLMPWIALVILIAEERADAIKPEFVDVQPAGANLPRAIETDSSLLPILDEYWRWAHVHITAQISDGNPLSEAELLEILRTEPERAVSRLLCPRRSASGARQSGDRLSPAKRQQPREKVF